MIARTIPTQMEQQLSEFLSWSNRSFTLEQFVAELEHWYAEFQAANCSLGYAAKQLGLNKIDLMHILDLLEWPVSNM
jgi:hypothetical protein